MIRYLINDLYMTFGFLDEFSDVNKAVIDKAILKNSTSKKLTRNMDRYINFLKKYNNFLTKNFKNYNYEYVLEISRIKYKKKRVSKELIELRELFKQTQYYDEFYDFIVLIMANVYYKIIIMNLIKGIFVKDGGKCDLQSVN